MKKTDCPKVVIGVCTYNRCKDLRRLLQSLIKLDYPNFEIIVVDNNSTDQTAQIVSGFEKVKYVFLDLMYLSTLDEFSNKYFNVLAKSLEDPTDKIVNFFKSVYFIFFFYTFHKNLKCYDFKIL